MADNPAVRGCLTFLLFLGALAVVGVIALPWIVGAAVGWGISSSGVTSGSSSVNVRGWGGDLLGGRAPGIEVNLGDVRLGEVSIGELRVELGGVGLFDRRFERIDGTARRSTVDLGGRIVAIEQATVTGPARDAAVTARITASEVTGLIEDAVRREIGLEVDASLTDGGVVLNAAGLTGSGDLVVERGALLLRSRIVTVRLLEAGRSSLWRLDAVRTDAAGITVDAHADVLAAADAAGLLP